MKAIFNFLLLIALVILGGVAVIKLVYGCSWKEAFKISDQFMTDLLG